jgi:hypothetical protein
MNTSRRTALGVITTSATASLLTKTTMAQQVPVTEAIFCIPGGWADRSDFIRRVVTHEPKGRFMFAGMVLADMQEKEQVGLEVHPRDPQIRRAFELAGQGKLTEAVLAAVDRHVSVAYLRAPPRLLEERTKVAKFTKLLEGVGGLAIKVESAGVAHTWERWRELVSGTAFDLYAAAVTLVADRDHYYSCGMHNFSLPDCEVPRTLPPEAAAELMNQFNHWRLTDTPVLADQHTFSLTSTAPRYRIQLEADARHAADEPFFNPHGLWRLSAA